MAGAETGENSILEGGGSSGVVSFPLTATSCPSTCAANHFIQLNLNAKECILWAAQQKCGLQLGHSLGHSEVQHTRGFLTETSCQGCRSPSFTAELFFSTPSAILACMLFFTFLTKSQMAAGWQSSGTARGGEGCLSESPGVACIMKKGCIW